MTFRKLESGVAQILSEQPKWWTSMEARVQRDRQWFRINFLEEPNAKRSVTQLTRLLEVRAEVGIINEDDKEETVAALLGTFDVWNPALLLVDLMFLGDKKTDEQERVAQEFDRFFSGEPYDIDFIEYENATGENL